MIKKTLFLLFVTISFFRAYGNNSPDWINPESRKVNYPASIYLTGFSSEPLTKGKTIEDVHKRLLNYSKLNLIESVQVSIKGISELNTVEENEEVNQFYKETISTSSSLNITGLMTETWYDKQKNIAYAFVYTRKSEALEYYKRLSEQKIEQIKQNINLAGKAYQSSDNQEAIKQYSACYPLFREIEEAFAITTAMNKSLINETDSQVGKIIQLKQRVTEGLQQIKKSDYISPDEAGSFIALSLLNQTGQLDNFIRLSNFTYQDTPMSSEFSLRFANIFQSKLIHLAGYSVSRDPSKGNVSENLIIQGSYWEEQNGVRIIAILRNADNGKVLASAENKISHSWFESNPVSVKPENFKDAHIRMQEFTKNELIGGDLNIEFWTNKGDGNLIYSEGEIMRIFVRTNKECYLRIIYHLADGSRVLLLDNYYISRDKVNTVYELPYEFECSEPFGVEVLQVNGQTKKFPILNTYKQYGYELIKNPLDEVLINNRGMKMVDKVKRAEKRIIITTLNK